MSSNGQKTRSAGRSWEWDRRTSGPHISSKSNDTQVVAAKNQFDLMAEEPKASLPSFQEFFQQILAESPLPARQTSPPRSLKPLGRPRQGILATSNVGRHNMPPSNNLNFPALQASAPSAAGSPESSQTLPSIGQALARLDGGSTPTPFAAPTLTLRFSRGPSPLSTMSTGATCEDMSATLPLSQPQYATQPPSLLTDTPNMSAYGEASFREASDGWSPTHSYPAPTELRAAGEKHPQGLVPGTNMHKCPYPGCTAGAFQTRNLLASHANVHSEDRPHFCPVTDCPRGIGGKGFKRKNEMIRHGLVHDSPGYACPFCIDEQHEHKYPRPDNLQRHVRICHVEKDKDDPLLREVLCQRTNRSWRGRGRGRGRGI